MEAFEQFVALAMEAEGLVVSGGLKFPVLVHVQKASHTEDQTHGFEVDLVGARSDRLVLATVKSYFGSRGVVAGEVDGTAPRNTGRYSLLHKPHVRETVARLAAERFGYSLESLEMRLYVGRFAPGHHEREVRQWCAGQVVGRGRIRVVDAHEVVAAVRGVAASKEYRDSAVLATLKVLQATGALGPPEAAGAP